MALYDDIGKGYRNNRRPDARIAAILWRELAGMHTILNVGAGTGAYEPAGCDVVAVEPSWTMIEQRDRTVAPCVRARAEALPFAAATFDCATAVLTIHHWADVTSGIREMRRVARRRVVLLTWIGFTERFWLLDYLPQIKAIDEPLFPALTQLASWLGPIRTAPVPIAHDCSDGFLCAYWRRPEAYLDENIRRSISTFARLPPGYEAGLSRLRDDLAAGRWHEQYAALSQREEMDFGYRVVVAEIDAGAAQVER